MQEIKEKHQNIEDTSTEKEVFWDPDNTKWIIRGQKRLKNEREHQLIKDVWKYEGVNLQTLIDFNCGIIKVDSGNEMIGLPYFSGCQIYSRDFFGRVYENKIAGSRPMESFFWCEKSIQGHSSLLILSSTMETMLLNRLFGKVLDTIGFCAKVPDLLSQNQKQWLTDLFRQNHYESINLFFDCHSEFAYERSYRLAQDIMSITGPLPVYLVNIPKYTNGACNTMKDWIRNKIDNNLFKSLLNNAERIQFSKPNGVSGQTPMIRNEDLKLPESLLEIIPPVLKDYLNYCSPLSDVPNEFLITPFLILLGVLIGNRRYVKIGGIKIFPGAWTVLFAGSSILRKSTALFLAKSLFKPVEEYLIRQYEEQMEEWNREKKQCETMEKDFEKPVPVQRTLYASDSFSDLTFWEAMDVNGSLASVTGEFTALWNELNRPRNGLKDQALRIYDSEDSIRRTTKSGGDHELNNPVWGIAGATTMDNFQRTLTSQERASGLLQRILPVYMEERTKEFRALTELQEPDEELYNRISARILELTDLEPSQVTLSTGAEELFTQWNYTINEQAEELSKTQSDVGGFASRLIAHGLKFSMIFQQFENQKLIISEQNMRAAIGLCDWLFKHILYMLGNNYIFNRVYSERTKLRDIIERQPSGKMSRTDLMRQSHFSKEQLDKAIAADVEAGFIKEIKTETNGRPLVEYALVRSK